MKKQIGNLLIFFSFLLLIYIYYPLASAYLPTDNQVRASANQSIIYIPKIHASAPVMENVDPGNKIEYKTALQLGVAEARGFSKPGEGKLVYLFAHSSLPPWEMTRTNTAFLRLNELQNGDQILISRDGQQIKYQVVDKKEYWPNQSEVFDEKRNENILILQTCTPIGTDLKRLLVFAKPI